jgi:prepilin-type processing-associated H-X9-DG protein
MSYFAKYGSSYRFGHAVFTAIAGANGSYEDDGPAKDANGNALSTDQIVTDSQFVVPADTRLMRDEEFPWFGPSADPAGAKYGYYNTTAASNFFQQWHPRGGSIVFVDGHAKFITSETAFDNIAGSPAGYTYDTPSPNQCWWGCD